LGAGSHWQEPPERKGFIMRMKGAAAMLLCACMVMAGCSGNNTGTTGVQAEESSQDARGTESGQNAGKTEPDGGENGRDMGVSDEEEPADTGEPESGAAGEYIFPESDTRLLTKEELEGMPADKLRYARNEIFARHGRLFDSAGLQEYFEEKDWYEGSVEPEDFSDSMLNEVEKENISRIKAWEDMGDILDTAAAYKEIMDGNELFGWNGLLDYGHIEVSMSGDYAEYYPPLEDKGSYYEAKGQMLCIPIYYEWDYIENIKPGDKMTLSFGMLGDSREYTVSGILQEHGREARVISVYAPGQGGDMALVFTDVFRNGKYALAVVDWLEGDNYVIWNSDDINCACETLYSGSFYLSKDCVVDVAGEMRSVEDQREVDWERNPFGGAIVGDIVEVDENGLITCIRQQVAG